MADPTPSAARRLTAARLTLHAAVQVPAALGTTRLPDRGDFQHTNLGWDPTNRAFVGRPVDGRAAGLRVTDLTWLVLETDHGYALAERPAAGRTLAQGLAWLREQVGGAPLDLGTWELPEHPAATEGAPLDHPEPAHLEELARWFDLAWVATAQAARAVADQGERSEVRVWPHHFDLAATLTLDPDADPEDARAITFGMTPGDGTVPEPYGYVSPWPYPPSPPTAPLDHGHWHTEGFTAAVAPGGRLPADHLGRAFQRFLDQAVQASLDLLDP